MKHKISKTAFGGNEPKRYANPKQWKNDFWHLPPLLKIDSDKLTISKGIYALIIYNTK